MRIAFFGTPDFAVPALRALGNAGHDVVRVYTQPPRRAGRGKGVRKNPVHLAADDLGVAVATPESLKDDAVQAAFRSLACDAAVVAAYGLILPAAILEAPRNGCLNIHASLLPRWRGAAPIQRAIFAGDSETGITIMRMDEGLDTGPMLLVRRIAIGDDAAGAVHDRLAEAGGEAIVTALAGVAAGTLSEAPQPDGATYAAKLTPDDELVDWSRPASELLCQVRALSPRPGAWFQVGGERWKLLSAEVTDGNGDPGTVLDAHLTIACGEGALRPLRLQRPGKRAMDAADVLRGNPVAVGTRLEW